MFYRAIERELRLAQRGLESRKGVLIALHGEAIDAGWCKLARVFLNEALWMELQEPRGGSDQDDYFCCM